MIEDGRRIKRINRQVIELNESYTLQMSEEFHASLFGQDGVAEHLKSHEALLKHINHDSKLAERIKEQVYRRDIKKNEAMLINFEKFMLGRYEHKIEHIYGLFYYYDADTESYYVRFVFCKSKIDEETYYTTSPFKITTLKAKDGDWRNLGSELATTTLKKLKESDSIRI